MYRTLASIVLALLVGLGLVGLTFSASTLGRADFRFINGTEPKTLDPGLMTGSPEGRVAEAVFEGLARRVAKTMQPSPGVAEAWDISPDGKRYTFHLRPGAQWNDGTKLDARDFLYSWKRLLDPNLGGEYAYILYPVLHAEALNTYAGKAKKLEGPVTEALDQLLAKNANGVPAATWLGFLREQELHDLLKAGSKAAHALLGRADVGLTPADFGPFRDACRDAARTMRQALAEAKRHFGVDQGLFAPDPQTLVVELRAPVPYFLDVVAFYPTYPVPRHVVERPGNAHDWFLPGKLVSNGAFRISEWVVNDHIRLEKSERYWGRDGVRLNSVDVLALENATTALNLYLTGDVDWLSDSYPKDLVDQLSKRPDFYRNPGNVIYFYRLNTKRPPLNDRRVRKALNLAIDRRVITEDVGRLGEIPAVGLVPPGIPGYEPPPSQIRFDVKEAQALLAEAGFPGGRGFPELGILFNTLDKHRKIAEVIADQLRQHLGIKVKAYNQEWQSYLAATTALDYDIGRAGWVGDYVDPNTFLDLWVTNGGQNRTGFSSSLYDQLIAAAGNVEAFLASSGDVPTSFRFESTRGAFANASQATDPVTARRLREVLRMRLFAEAEAILTQDEFPVIPLYFYVMSGLVAPKVHGFYSTLELADGRTGYNLQDVHPLQDIWLEGRTAAP